MIIFRAIQVIISIVELRLIRKKIQGNLGESGILVTLVMMKTMRNGRSLHGLSSQGLCKMTAVLKKKLLEVNRNMSF